MAGLPITDRLLRAGTWEGPAETCTLSYEDRFFRRRRLTGAGGTAFVADFAQVTHLDHGDAFELPTGALIEVVAAPEPLLEVRGEPLARLAWHVGNRHTPCQVGPGFLLIRDDPVIAHMLEGLGATLTRLTAPFTPEGGAYGHGRTHSHAHGASAHVP